MNSNQLGWTAFLVAIASVTSPPAEAAVVNNDVPSQSGTIESRIARIHSTITNKADATSPLGNASPSAEVPTQVAIGWGNGRGGGTFVNLGRGGWGNGSG
ncbi:rSAM-associated Gly-rich repeat protein, partial [Synechocystis salina LEGE 06155]|nr:rSAM-associated Gly-rich repeat protein [Synechocystis salina LEGE 06155]